MRRRVNYPSQIVDPPSSHQPNLRNALLWYLEIGLAPSMMEAALEGPHASQPARQLIREWMRVIAQELRERVAWLDKWSGESTPLND